MARLLWLDSKFPLIFTIPAHTHSSSRRARYCETLHEFWFECVCACVCVSGGGEIILLAMKGYNVVPICTAVCVCVNLYLCQGVTLSQICKYVDYMHASLSLTDCICIA